MVAEMTDLELLYRQGLWQSALAGPAAATIGGASVLLRGRLGPGGLPGAVAAVVALAVSGFLLAFPLVNLWFIRDQWLGRTPGGGFETLPLWDFELKVGVLAARLAAVSLGVRGIQFALRQLSPEAADTEDRELIQVLDPATQALVTGCQSLLHLAAVGVGWWSVAILHESPRIIVLNWAVPFLSLQWHTIADYMHHFRGRILVSHYWQVVTGNLLLGGLILHLLWSWQNPQLGAASLGPTGWSVGLAVLVALEIVAAMLLFPATRRFRGPRGGRGGGMDMTSAKA
jgi:hypothetical protein